MSFSEQARKEWDAACRYVYPNMPNRAYFGTPLFSQLDKDKRYVAEIKRNGWRCLALKTRDQLELWTRHGTLIVGTKNSKLEGIRESLKYIPDMTLIDGELLDRRTKDIKDTYYVFDLLWWANKPLWNLPLWQRREFLESVLKTNDHILLAEQFRVGRKFLYTRAIEGGDEGIVFKRLDSIYMIGSTKYLINPAWIKIKKDEAHFVKEVTHG
jgi:ATP-dependent DNA ligase